jgi:uncharacterized protein (DUF58 family)
VYLGYRLTSRRRRAASIGVELAEVRPPEELEALGAFCLYLPAGATFESGSRFVARRRGRYVLSRLRLFTRFPFLLVKAQKDLAIEDAMIVWPALGKLRAELLTHGATEISDAAPSRVGSGSDEFFGLREYRQGDNPRWIHWKRTAGSGRPVVREMSRPRPDVLYVLLDTHLADASPAALILRERLIRLAATLVDHAFKRQYRVGLLAARREQVMALAAGAGVGHRTALLDALAAVDHGDTRPFGEALAAMPRRLLHHAEVVLISPRPEALGELPGLRAACRHLTVVGPAQVDELYEDDLQAAEADRQSPA